MLPKDPTTGAPFPERRHSDEQLEPGGARKSSDYPQFPVPNAAPLITTPGAYISTVINTVRVGQVRYPRRSQHFEHVAFVRALQLLGLDDFPSRAFHGLCEGSNNDQFGNTLTRGQSAVAGSTVTFNPTTLLDLRLGYTRLGANVFPPNFGSPSTSNCWVFRMRRKGRPSMRGGPSSTSPDSARSAAQPRSRNTRSRIRIWRAALFRMQRGAHNIRVGSDATYIQTAILDVSALRGTFNFSNTWTGNPCGDFLLGLPASYTQTSPTVAYNRNWIYNFFIQDDYRVLPNLTLNLGLRYEYGTPIYEKYNHLDNYELATGNSGRRRTATTVRW